MKRTIANLTLFLTLVASYAPLGAYRAPDSFAPVVKKTRSGVVNISTTRKVRRTAGPRMNEDLFRFFFGDAPPPMDTEPNEHTDTALGSGFVVDASGYIVTNNHVVREADEIVVKLNDQKEFKATVVGADPSTDLALIKIEPGNETLHPLELGDSDALEIGEWVLAIGNPLGLEWSVTAGIVSARGRVLGDGPYEDFIQTDTSINPGNSGGPLLNTNGEVVGINTAIIPQGQGLGFAIPVNMLKEILPELKKGRVERGWLGIALQKLTPELAKSFGLKDTKGALISDVNEGEPAEKAGIRSGDVVVAFEGKKVESPRDLIKQVGLMPPGKSVQLSVIRNGQSKSFRVKLGRRDDHTKVAGKQESPGKGNAIAVKELSPRELSSLGIRGGVRVTDVRRDSAAFAMGLRPGNIIVWINHKEVDSVETFVKEYSGTKKGETISLKVVGQGYVRFMAFQKDME